MCLTVRAGPGRENSAILSQTLKTDLPCWWLVRMRGVVVLSPSLWSSQKCLILTGGPSPSYVRGPLLPPPLCLVLVSAICWPPVLGVTLPRSIQIEWLTHLSCVVAESGLSTHTHEGSLFPGKESFFRTYFQCESIPQPASLLVTVFCLL